MKRSDEFDAEGRFICIRFEGDGEIALSVQRTSIEEARRICGPGDIILEIVERVHVKGDLAEKIR